MTSEVPFVRKDSKVDWSAVRGEVSTYINFCIVVGLCWCCVEVTGAIKGYAKATTELATAVRQLSYKNEIDIAKAEGREPRVQPGSSFQTASK